MKVINYKTMFSVTLFALSHAVAIKSSAQSLDIVIPQIKKHYCVSFENNGKRTLQQMASTLLDFKSYPDFDGKGAKYPIFGFSITPFDLYISKEVVELRQENLSTEWPQFNVTTSVKFGIQPAPMWDVEPQYYPKLKLDCQTSLLPKETSGYKFNYRCQLDQNYDKNYGLKRFDTVMVAETPSTKCQGEQSYLEIVGDITVDGDDFTDLKQGLMAEMPLPIQAVGNEFIAAFFDPPKLFTNFYSSFYGGWVAKSSFLVHKSW